MKLALLAFVLVLAGFVHADPATQPSTSVAVIDATDDATLKAAEGKKVTVKGEISRSFPAKTVLLLNFKGVKRGGFTVAIRKADQDALNAAFGGDVAKELKGKTVLVTGEIKLYKDQPEMEVTKPEQIKIDDK